MSIRPLGLLLAGALFFPTPAHAETELIPIVFGKLAGRRIGDDLVIEYRIDAKSWRRMESDRIRPQLHVTLENADRGPPTRVTFDRDLVRQEGAVTLSVPSSLGKLRCEIWVTGGHRGAHIAWMDVGGFEVERASLRIGASSGDVVMNPPPAPPPPVAPPTNWAAEPRVIEACGAAFDGPANEKACVVAVKSSPRDPISSITSCEAAMDGDGNELECIRAAIKSAFDPSPAISACEAAMDGDANELECLRIGLSFSKDPTQVIAACDSARTGDPDELECLRTAVN